MRLDLAETAGSGTVKRVQLASMYWSLTVSLRVRVYLLTGRVWHGGRLLTAVGREE